MTEPAPLNVTVLLSPSQARVYADLGGAQDRPRLALWNAADAAICGALIEALERAGQLGEEGSAMTGLP